MKVASVNGLSGVAGVAGVAGAFDVVSETFSVQVGGGAKGFSLNEETIMIVSPRATFCFLNKETRCCFAVPAEPNGFMRLKNFLTFLPMETFAILDLNPTAL